MVNRGVFMTPGDEEQWTLSVQHTEADIDRYVDAFAEFCAELAAWVKRRPPDVLDDSDKAIVELLQEDGRMSYTRIARVVGLSEAAVRTRVQRLIEGNVVQIVGVTDPLRLGFRRQAMVGVKTEGDISTVADTLAAIPEVDYVVFVGGSYDLLFEIVCEDDEHLLSILNDKVRTHPRCPHHRHLHLPPVAQADVRLGNPLAVLAVGVPREVKTEEHRVAITPDGVAEMTHRRVPVLIEQDAGVDSGFSDADYRSAGAEIVGAAAEVWERAGLILKVKEPQEQEFRFLRPDLALFTYLHLAAYPEVAHALLAAGTTGIAYETVQLPNGQLPLLAPMSEVAGRMAPQIGAHFLERAHGGRGVLLGGAPGVRPARVVVLGAGNVGWNAAWIAQGMEAEVLLLDKNLDRLRWVDQIHKGRIMTLGEQPRSRSRARWPTPIS